MALRILSGIVVIVSAIIFPWWVSVIFAVAGLFYFGNFYEVLIVGLILDTLYGSHIFFTYVPYIATTVLLVGMIVIAKIRTRLIMY